MKIDRKRKKSEFCGDFFSRDYKALLISVKIHRERLRIGSYQGLEEGEWETAA